MAKKASPAKRLKKSPVQIESQRERSALAIGRTAMPGEVVGVEPAGDGTARSVLAVDFRTLEKGAIYMTRAASATWLMATKFCGPTPVEVDDPPQIVFVYDGPFR